ncbi:MAG: hypothetical protein MUP26_08840, partial [Desulfobulbaceae bacterium]|nr:hypothetical protein [Desulfobulbaceae bacterium]
VKLHLSKSKSLSKGRSMERVDFDFDPDFDPYADLHTGTIRFCLDLSDPWFTGPPHGWRPEPIFMCESLIV